LIRPSALDSSRFENVRTAPWLPVFNHNFSPGAAGSSTETNSERSGSSRVTADEVADQSILSRVPSWCSAANWFDRTLRSTY
jgi:hypothetical protein